MIKVLQNDAIDAIGVTEKATKWWPMGHPEDARRAIRANQRRYNTKGRRDVTGAELQQKRQQWAYSDRSFSPPLNATIGVVAGRGGLKWRGANK